MKFAVCLSMTEKAELNIHETSHFSQFRAITMLIIHTVSAGLSRRKMWKTELTRISHNLFLFAAGDNLIFIHHSYILILHMIAEKTEISTTAKIINIWESYESCGQGYQRRDVCSPAG